MKTRLAELETEYLCGNCQATWLEKRIEDCVSKIFTRCPMCNFYAGNKVSGMDWRPTGRYYVLEEKE